MKPMLSYSKLSHAVLLALTTATLTACGGDDGGEIYNHTQTPAVTPATENVAQPTPAPAPAVDESAKIASILENAKLAGLTEENAKSFAEAVKALELGSDAYKAALEEARKNQAAAIAETVKSEAVSPIVDSNNPFIGQVDVRITPTVSSNHYVRQLGSTYERTANPSAIAGLGGVAIDDPTKSNPWLSNYVLGTEVVRLADGSVKVIAVDSAGEMVEPLNDGTDRARKLGDVSLPGLAATGDSAHSPYFTTHNGLHYKTQRGSGVVMEYNYLKDYDPLTGLGTGAANRGPAPNMQVRTIQEQSSQHSTIATSNEISRALSAAKDRIIFSPNANSGTPVAGEIDGAGRNLDDSRDTAGFLGYFRSGLIVYASNSVPVGHKIGKDLGHRVPMWGKEENIYQINPETDLLEVINGVDPNELDVLRAAAAGTPAGARAGNPTRLNLNRWYNSRYGAVDQIRQGGSGLSLNEDGSTYSPTETNANGTKQVANNDSVRVYGKNHRDYLAGAEGKQTTANSYIGRYDRTGTMLTNGISFTKLDNVQYGRLTNNIDVLAESEIEKAGNGKDRIIYRPFQPHGAPNSVDTYFYRGTNHTTIEQMENLKKTGGVIQYHGHALTYNLGPYAPDESQSSGTIPTAYGSQNAGGNTIGNFVEARFDVAKSTLAGSIYNFINKEKSVKDEDFKKQDLARFQGTVYGNTVIGTAQKVGVAGTGSLTASFFGEGAKELGGNISSISREKGYGDADWGAVFGATRGSSVDNFNVIEQ